MPTTRTTSLRQRGADRSRGAFTLIECLVSVLIVGVVLVAAVGTFGQIAKGRQNQVDRTAGVALGEQLLAEILQCYFKEPGSASTALGPDTGETTRAAFDDVDDYDGLSSSPPVLRDGTTMPDYAGWTRSTAVICVKPDQPNTPIAAGDPQLLKRITVTVKSPNGSIIIVRGLRCVDGAYEQPPSTTTNYLTWGGVYAKVGEKGKTMYGGSHPLNVVTSQ
jgi:prepilin-type N-terminal cleavage/methylation domain-containing protein